MLEQISKLLTKVFGTKSSKDLKKIWPIVEEVNSFEEEMKTLSEDELKEKTESFRALIKERNEEISTQIVNIKEKMDSSDESITLEERREFSDQLAGLEDQWLDNLEDTLDEILPEAYAVLKETCRRFVGKSWKVAGSEIK